MHKLFVYGTLLSGFGNHGHFLSNSKLLGQTRSPRGFAITSLGWYPGAFKTDDNNDSILGEVYEIDDHTLRHVDGLEGYRSESPESGLYNRIEIDTEFGKAFIYTYNRYKTETFVKIPDGNWREYVTKKSAR